MVRSFGVNVDDYGSICRRNRLIQGPIGRCHADPTRRCRGECRRDFGPILDTQADSAGPRNTAAADQGWRGTLSALRLAGGVGGSSSSHSWCRARSSQDRCMRISSARSADDTALAAKVPQVAAARRYLDALSNWDALDTALSSLQAGAQLSLGHRRLASSRRVVACR